VSVNIAPRNKYQELQLKSAKARSVNKLERRIRELVESAPPLTRPCRSWGGAGGPVDHAARA
jgi:hypothetical protein